MNKTTNDVSLPCQDGDLYIKLERLTPRGEWERAQSHRYGWCGNSYYAVTLKEAEFVTLPGYCPSNGEKSIVRYRSYDGAALVSNQGEGEYRACDVEEARIDEMSRRCIPRTLDGIFSDPHPFPRLGSMSAEWRAAGLELLRHYDQAYYYRDEAAKWIRRIREAPENTQALRAAKLVERLLHEPWERACDRRALAERAVRALTSEAPRQFGSPENARVLVWCLVEELVYSHPPDAFAGPGNNYAYDSWGECEAPLSPEQRSALVAECQRVLREGPDPERCFAASVVTSRSIGAGLVEPPFVDSLVGDRDSSVWRWAAMSMVKSSQRVRLVGLAPKRPREDWLHIVWMFKYQMPEHLEPEEFAFWQKCAELMPASMAYVLDQTPLKTNRAFRVPIRQYLEKEIEHPTVLKGGTQDQYSLVGALRLLASWNVPEDTELILSYLGHPCSIDGTRHTAGWSGPVRFYQVRQRAGELLRGRGVSIPPNTVFEEEMSPPSTSGNE